MRPAGATLRLFAQWLRPTTNKGNPTLRGWFFLPTTTCLFGLLELALQVVVRPLSEE